MASDYLQNYLDTFYLGEFSGQRFRWKDPDNRTRNRTFIQGHLSNPITQDEQEFLLKYNKMHCHRHRVLKDEIEDLNIKKTIYESCDPYDCFTNSLFNRLVDDKEFNEYEMKVNKLLCAALLSLKINKKYFNSNNEIDSNNFNLEIVNLYRDITRSQYWKDIIKAYINKTIAEEIKDTICNKSYTYGEFLEYKNIIKADRDSIFFNCPQHGWTIGPTTLLICNLDIHQGRFYTLFNWIIADIKRRYLNFSIYQEGTRLITIFESLRTSFKNQFFTIIATWEPLVLGYILKDKEEDLGYEDLYNECYQTINDIIQDEIIMAELLPPSTDHLTLMLFSELLGMTKLFGHPCIDAVESFNKIKEHSNDYEPIDFDTLQKLKATFVKEFCISYIMKHNYWPKVKYIGDKKLRKIFEKNLKIHRKDNIQLAAWATVQFDKVFEFDFSLDTTELLKDSAIAPPMSKWYTQFDHCAFKNLHGKNKPKGFLDLKDKRVIPRFLTGAESEAYTKINEAILNYYDDEDDMAVLCRKERELKEMGRVFVKQTYKQRLLQTSIEKNIADTIMPFFHDSTMIDSELELVRKQMSAVHNLGHSQEIINLDLTKWCLRFRHTLVQPFGKVLDELFGTPNLYEKNHIWFHGMNVFCNSRFFPPDYDTNTSPIEGPTFFKGQRGGLEGMRQKLWTLITICIIRYVSETLNIKINVMGQGDNQIILIRYTPDQYENKEELRNTFLDVLDKVFTSVNLKLKKQETWISKRLFEYGKVRYLNGYAVNQTTKKLFRLIPDINDGISSFASGISTINTITESAAKCDTSPDISFIINQIEILNYLDRKKVINITRNSVYEMTALLFSPSDFGGLPLSSYINHVIRGLDDKLSYWSGLINFISYHDEKLMEQMSKHLVYMPLKYRNLNRLFEDIFALNIKGLPNLSTELKQCSDEYLKSEHVTNPEIKRLLDPELSVSKDYLYQELSKMQPLFLPLAYELIRHSNAGILINFRNRFTNVSTINQMIQANMEVDYLYLSEINMEECKEIIQKRMVNPVNHTTVEVFKQINCPTKFAKDLRRIHWGLDLIGDTKPNIIHQFKLKNMDDCTLQESSESIGIILSKELCNSKGDLHLVKGPFRPYFGSITQEKISKPSLEVHNPTTYLKSIKRLYFIKTWLKRTKSTNLIKLVDLLIEEKLPVIPPEIKDLDLQDWCIKSEGGNIIHRFKSVIEKNIGVANYLPTLGSHFKYTTNNLVEFGKGGKDFTIHFQLGFLLAQRWVYEISNTFSKCHSQYNLIIKCPDCTENVTNIELDIVQPPSAIHSDPAISTHQVSKLFLKVEKNISQNHLRKLLSIKLGRSIGHSFDRYYSNSYLNTQSIDEENPYFAKIDVSINDFKYCTITELLVGIIQQSSHLRNLLLEKYFPLELIKNRSFVALSQLLINSGRLFEFVEFFGITIEKHSEGITPHGIAEVLFHGILNYINNNSIFPLYALSHTFPDDSLTHLAFHLGWTMKYINTMLPRDNITKDLRKLYFSSVLKNKIGLLQFTEKLLNNFGIQLRCHTTNISEIQTMWRDKVSENTLFGWEYLKQNNPNRPKKEGKLQSYTPLFDNSHHFYTQYYIQAYQEGKYDIPQFHHLGRQICNISSAFNKYLELIDIVKLDCKNLNDIVCLAEGSGGCITGLGHIFNTNTLHYNTILTPDIDPREGTDQNYPPAMVEFPDLLKRLSKVSGLNTGETDIFSELFIQKFERHFKNYPIHLLTMDAESPMGIDPLIFIRKYLELFNTVVKCNNMIIKIFLRTEEEYHLLTLLLKQNKNYIYLIFKPTTSGIANGEFLLYLGLKIEIEPETYMNIVRLQDAIHIHIPKIIKFMGKKQSLRAMYYCYDVMGVMTRREVFGMIELYGDLWFWRRRQSCSYLCGLEQMKRNSVLTILLGITSSISEEEFKNLVTRLSNFKEELQHYIISYIISILIKFTNNIIKTLIEISIIGVNIHFTPGKPLVACLSDKDDMYSFRNHRDYKNILKSIHSNVGCEHAVEIIDTSDDKNMQVINTIIKLIMMRCNFHDEIYPQYCLEAVLPSADDHIVDDEQQVANKK